MDYKERYNAALRRAKEYHDNGGAPLILEVIFPELKEPKEEQIRKKLIKAFGSMVKEQWGGIAIKDILAWLEKQGKQNFDYEHADIPQKDFAPIEPKFKEQDWIIHQGTGNIYQVVAIIDNQYQLKYGDNYTVQNCADVDEGARLYDVAKDAKDGDVLVNGSNIFIFHFINYTRLMGYCHVNIDDGRFYDDLGTKECFCTIDAIVTPATKEQRDTLIKAMANAGYTFDFEKKEFKKVEVEKLDADKVIAWLDEHVPTKFEDMTNYVQQFKKDFDL